jgi:pantoate kinase
MTSEAFCPGHITALFYAPPRTRDPARTGSRGAGLCIDKGVRARVHALRGQGWGVGPGPSTRLAPVVATTLGNYLLGAREEVYLQLDLDIALPVGQGFGMSGAMALAAVVAADGELGLLKGDMSRLAALAHAAEVEFRTGLGDVVCQARGGLEIRTRPGLPPHGEVVTAPHDGRLLVAWADRPLHTASVLGDRGTRDRIEATAAPLLEGAPGRPTMDWLLEAGRAFTDGAGLAGGEVASMLELCGRSGRASQIMLGNSVFAVGDLDAMEDALSAMGFHHMQVGVDEKGARLLRGGPRRSGQGGGRRRSR